MKVLTIKKALNYYNSVSEYCQKMGECANCINIRRTPKYIRPVKYYCLFFSNEMLDGEDRDFTDNDIIFINKTRIPCNKGFEAKKSWRKKVEKLFIKYKQEII